MPHSYQLTRYPLGSLREIWALSWPLILSLFSASLMHFSDRILLSHYSLDTLNAATTSGTAAYSLLILPMSLAGISQVFVGRFHGKNKLAECGKPVWQMIFFSLMTIPIFVLLASTFPEVYFKDSRIKSEETLYFSWLLFFSPIFCLNAALCGFFTGTGKVKIVTICIVFANALNIFLDLILIYGKFYFPELGIKGAVLATGIAESLATFLLFAIFLSNKNRRLYHTLKPSWDVRLFKESFKVGLPAGLSVAIEVNAHFLFMKMISYTGEMELSIASLLQSLYFLVMFLPEGLSKAVTALSSNLIGGQESKPIFKMLKSAFILHTIFFTFLASFLFFFFTSVLETFFIADLAFIKNPQFLEKASSSFLYFLLFFLVNGFSKILTGHLTAAKDTRFILKVESLLILIAYLLPLYYALMVSDGGVKEAWAIFFFHSFFSFLIFGRRYLSSRWAIREKDAIKAEEA